VNALRDRSCQPLTGAPMDPTDARALLSQLQQGWRIADDGKSLHRAFAFADFADALSLANAVGWIANSEDHHPEIELGWGYCRVAYSTHSVGGLTVNDFICAAKIDALF
jgi:4a-hydroxytetrahydrobiopterin dehydratase